MKAYKILTAASFSLAVAGAGLLGLTGYRHVKRTEIRDAEVAKMVARFKACPDDFNARRECLGKEEAAKMLTEAEAARKEGRYEEAATKFSTLGRWNEAFEMAGKCPGDARARLRVDFEMRKSAVEKALADPSPRSGPKPEPSGSAAPGASSSTQ
jgi:hypothetical protein